MRPCDLEKSREIVFHALPAGQAARARALLDGLEGLSVSGGDDDRRIRVRYNVCEYTLAGLESALTAQGFHLDNGLISKLRRALAYYCENVQRSNVAANESDLTQQAYVNVYERHLHGDRDDTPEAWRDYK